tara:strand:+ start:59 stop:439 length:381 start_codon:yes stop_codon:yes gene_type:complete
MPRKARDSHSFEKTVELVKEKFEVVLEQMKEFSTTPSGRYMFSVLLSDREQLGRWRDPMQRQRIEQQIAMDSGDAGIAEYHAKMADLEGKARKKLTKAPQDTKKEGQKIMGELRAVTSPSRQGGLV